MTALTTTDGEYLYEPTAPYVLSELGSDYEHAIVRTEDGEVMGVDGWQQAMCVEDATFTRDLAWIIPELNRLAEKIERMADVVGDSVSADGRYIVHCDDGSLIATDELMDGDYVLVDRGENW